MQIDQLLYTGNVKIINKYASKMQTELVDKEPN